MEIWKFYLDTTIKKYFKIKICMDDYCGMTIFRRYSFCQEGVVIGEISRHTKAIYNIAQSASGCNHSKNTKMEQNCYSLSFQPN